jgi:hypothetical protein
MVRRVWRSEFVNRRRTDNTISQENDKCTLNYIRIIWKIYRFYIHTRTYKIQIKLLVLATSTSRFIPIYLVCVNWQTTRLIRIRKSKKNRQHNLPRKWQMYIHRSTKHTHNTKDRVTGNPLKIGRNHEHTYFVIDIRWSLRIQHDNYKLKMATGQTIQ